MTQAFEEAVAARRTKMARKAARKAVRRAAQEAARSAPIRSIAEGGADGQQALTEASGQDLARLALAGMTGAGGGRVTETRARAEVPLSGELLEAALREAPIEDLALAAALAMPAGARPRSPFNSPRRAG